MKIVSLLSTIIMGASHCYGVPFAGVEPNGRFAVSGFCGDYEGSEYIIKAPTDQIIIRYTGQILAHNYVSATDESWVLLNLMKKRENSVGSLDFFGLLLVEKKGRNYFAREVTCVDSEGKKIKNLVVRSFENQVAPTRIIRLTVSIGEVEDKVVAWKPRGASLNLDTGKLDLDN